MVLKELLFFRRRYSSGGDQQGIWGNSMLRSRDCQKGRQPTGPSFQFEDISKGKILMEMCETISLRYLSG